MAGITGRLFREFGLTISGAVLISAAIALTLTPMLSSRLLKTHTKGRLFVATEPFFAALERGYARVLDRALAWPLVAVAVVVGAVALAFGLESVLPKELAPLEDRGRVWVRATAPDGVSYEHMQRFMDEIAAETARRVPEAHLMMTQVPGSSGNGVQGAVNNGFVRLFLDDAADRGRTQQQIAADLRALARDFTGARVNITQEASIGERRSSSTGVEFVLQAPELEMIRERLPAFLDAARANAVFSFVDSDLTFSSPEVRVNIDRAKAQALGVSTLDIAETLQAGLSGQRFGFFIYNGRQYDVIGQLTRDLRAAPGDLGNLTRRQAHGAAR
jgi:multidrug efflux pump